MTDFDIHHMEYLTVLKKSRQRFGRILVLLCLTIVSMASNITSTLQTTTATDTTSLVTETVTYNDSFQTTEAQRKPDPGLQLAYSIIIPAVTAFIMFAMGCDITPLEVWKRLRRPVAPLIGGLCQVRTSSI